MNYTSSTAIRNIEISRRLVPTDQRLSIFPKYFQGAFSHFEAFIFNWMERICLSYRRGYWEMYELSNGAFYMAPAADERFDALCSGLGQTVELSADAAGVVVCLLAVNQLAKHIDDDHYFDLYHRLRDYAAEHAEAGNIFRIVD